MSWFCDAGIGCRKNDCSFDLWAPDHRTKGNNVGFSAFALYTQTIEDFIDVLAATNDPNDEDIQYAAAAQVGLNINSLTSKEIEYIEREVARRYG